MGYNLPTDSGDYYLLTKGVELSAHAEGLTCEIGLRTGGGTKHIMEALSKYRPGKVHIAIDPYGNILYGVPVYNQVKTIWKTYSFVHFDGPHAFDSLMTEIDFFYKRITPGACWYFDDVKGYLRSR
jgi:hypothetical protein